MVKAIDSPPTLRIHFMTRRDRIASGPGGGAGTSGGGWDGRSMSGRMEVWGGGRKDGFGECGLLAEVTFVPTGLRNKARGCEGTSYPGLIRV